MKITEHTTLPQRTRWAASKRTLFSLCLGLLFALPGIAAYFFYQHPTWLSATKVNRGKLLQPAEPVAALGPSTAWKLVLWSPLSCKQACLRQLDKLARVRLALGRRAYDVELILLLDASALPPGQKTQALLDGRSIAVRRTATLSYAGGIFIANPNDYMMLGYASDCNPDDIYQDIKLLLTMTTQQSKHGTS